MLKKNLKHFAEKSLSVFEVLEWCPFKHTKTYFHKIFFLLFFTIHKNVLVPIQDLFFFNIHIKMKNKMTARSLSCSVSAKFFPMLVETPYFGGVINPKTYLNYDLSSKFLFPE